PTVLTKSLFKRDDGVRPLAQRVNLDAPFTVGGYPFQQRLSEMLAIVYPIAHDQGLVKAAHPGFAQNIVQCHQRTAPLGNHEYTRGFAVKAVRQFQKWFVGPRRTHLFNYTKRHPAAAM